ARLRAPDSWVAGVVAGTDGPLAVPLACVATESVLHQPFFTQLCDEGARLALDRSAAVVETLLQSNGNVALGASGLDLPHHRRCGGIERIDLLGACLEQHAAEFLFAKFHVLRKLHGPRR